MITIPPVNTPVDQPPLQAAPPLQVEMATDAPPSNPEELAPAKAQKEQVPVVWIPATLCVGLLIAAIYLGARIVSAHHAEATPHAAIQQARPVIQKPQLPPPMPPPVVQAAAQTPPPAPVQIAPAAAIVETAPVKHLRTELPLPETELPMIAPQAGERYLQVGALDTKLARRYIPQLREAKLDPHIAEGPTPDLLRILIGPFHDHDSLTAVKQQLDGAKIENFVREY
jgi:hypothetical protein